MQVDLAQQGAALRFLQRIQGLGFRRRLCRTFGFRDRLSDAVVRGEAAAVESVAGPQSNHPAQNVAQLSDVAWPRVRAESVDEVIAQADRRCCGGFLRENMANQ